MRTRCKQGHELTEENTYVTPRGWRQCQTCKREASRKYRKSPKGRKTKAEYNKINRKPRRPYKIGRSGHTNHFIERLKKMLSSGMTFDEAEKELISWNEEIRP